MVASHHIHLDESGLNIFLECLGGAKIVDAPSDISLAGAILVAPPGVVPPGGFEVAEGVHKSLGEDLVEGGSLLHGEAGVPGVLSRAGKVDFFVSDIHVTAKHDRLRFLE